MLFDIPLKYTKAKSLKNSLFKGLNIQDLLHTFGSCIFRLLESRLFIPYRIKKCLEEKTT